MIRQVDCGRLEAAEFVLVVFELTEKGDKFRRERECKVRRRSHLKRKDEEDQNETITIHNRVTDLH